MRTLLASAALLLLERVSRSRQNSDLARIKSRDEMTVYHLALPPFGTAPAVKRVPFSQLDESSGP